MSMPAIEFRKRVIHSILRCLTRPMDHEELVVWIMRVHYYSETGARRLLGEMKKANWILIERVRERDGESLYAVTKISVRAKRSRSDKKKLNKSKQSDKN